LAALWSHGRSALILGIVRRALDLLCDAYVAYRDVTGLVEHWEIELYLAAAGQPLPLILSLASDAPADTPCSTSQLSSWC
jgi:hypothetical protein